MTSAGLRAKAAPARVRTMLRSSAGSQTAIYTGSNVVASLVGAAIKVVLAGQLTVDDFGSFVFVVSFVMFVALFFEFGLFLPVARLLAQAEEHKRGELIGAALLIYVPVGLAYTLTLFVASYVVDDIFHVEVADALRLSAALSVGYPFALVGLQLAQGLDRLHMSSVTAAAAQLLFGLALAAIMLLGVAVSLDTTVLLRAIAALVVAVWLARWFAPKFRGARDHVRPILRAARAYGFQVYVGRVLAVGTYNMDILMLAALTNTKQVAIYALAGAIAAGVGLPVTGLANALFGRMVLMDVIDRRWLTAAWLLGLAGAGAAWVCGALLVPSLFPATYGAAVGLIPIMGLAQAVRGATGIYNSFLAAQARGRDLQQAAVVLTVSNLLLNIGLIPLFEATGAAWASFFALVANLVAHVVAYRRYSRDRPPGPTDMDPTHA